MHDLNIFDTSDDFDDFENSEDFDNFENSEDFDDFESHGKVKNINTNEIQESTLKVLKNPKRQRHHYTDELELKSIMIRFKNSKIKEENLPEDANYISTLTDNPKIAALIKNDIKRFINIKQNINDIEKKSTSENARTRLRSIQAKLKERVVKYSETQTCDKETYERLGEISLLMIKNILRKPNFSFLENHDDFYSDALYKILKYIRNFDHKKISKRSGYEVNAFAYVSQIIHNSVIYIINQRKREEEKSTEYFIQESDSYVTKHTGYESADDLDIYAALSTVCPLEFPFEIEDAYPFVVKDLLNYIESNAKTSDGLIQCILEYSLKSKMGPVLVGDAIRSDEYLVKFIENASKVNTSLDW